MYIFKLNVVILICTIKLTSSVASKEIKWKKIQPYTKLYMTMWLINRELSKIGLAKNISNYINLLYDNSNLVEGSISFIKCIYFRYTVIKIPVLKN